MTDLVQYNKKVQQAQICQTAGSSESCKHAITTVTNKSEETITNTNEMLGISKVLCTHDGVLLKKTCAEHIADLNTSGALSLVEYTTAKRLYLEWKPNESILIADDSQDQGEWSLVDTISQRTRTTSESRVFSKNVNNTDLNNGLLSANGESVSGSVSSSVGSDGWSLPIRSRVIRIALQELSKIVVKQRGQLLRCIKATDGTVVSEYFFQHGNADLFVQSMRQLHVIDVASNSTVGRHVEEYNVLNSETQKLKKTFAELDIGEIKASPLQNESWLPSKVVGFLVNIPDYVPPAFQRNNLKTRPTTFEHYDMLNSTTQKTNKITEPTHMSKSDESVDESPTADSVSNVEEEEPLCELPSRIIVKRGKPLNKEQWQTFKNTDGRISEVAQIRDIIFHGGIETELRSEVWKYLLNFYIWDESTEERLQRCEQKSKEYYTMKAQWLSMTTTQEANFDGYRERKSQIDKDVKRTDRTTEFYAGEENPNLVRLQGILMTYVMYNFDLGYVQGMSDLLAPILIVMDNEVDAFWCFVGFMKIILYNFDIDQAGIKSQFKQIRSILRMSNPKLFQHLIQKDSDNMYVCFRWLLVWYKREFLHEDVLKLWECLWTRLPCPNFHLLISVAILEQQSETIIANNLEFTEILKHVNELSEQIDLESILCLAESIYYQLKDSKHLDNEVRAIIGEPLLVTDDQSSTSPTEQPDFDDGFADLVPEITQEEKQRQEELLEEACERSMFLQLT